VIKSKIETYLGFCVRAQKIVLGTTEIERKKKGVYLLLADGGIGKNSLKIMANTQQKLSCPLYVTKESGMLGEYLHRPAVKAVAITDQNLATAILSTEECEQNFKLYPGGIN
jgi:hypothetical protein